MPTASARRPCRHPAWWPRCCRTGSTAAFDRGAKFAAYRLLPSLQEYLLVDIERRRLELFRLELAGWVLHELAATADEPASLWLASVGLALLATEVFGDLDVAAGPVAGGRWPHWRGSCTAGLIREDYETAGSETAGSGLAFRYLLAPRGGLSCP